MREDQNDQKNEKKRFFSFYFLFILDLGSYIGLKSLFMYKNIAILTISQEKNNFFYIFDKFWAFFQFFVKKREKNTPGGKKQISKKKGKK